MEKLKYIIKNIRRRLNININFLFAKRNIASFKGKPIINVRSEFNGRTHLGFNTHFNGLSITGKGRVFIGDNFHSGRDCLIISDAHDYKIAGKLPYDEKLITPDTIIEKNVWLGSRVIILAGITIGYGSIIQAGSVVVKNVPPLAIMGGHPAKQFSERSVSHYENLDSSHNT
ncbi:acyltransferase [Moritella viscosa]|uniref:Acetyltransferase, isoleucine patch superfamily protein n=1 Tax=Moritella viscosa TaxID=80854 RepID=A0A090IHA6_9GAMM|nr:acyltransferase [Moritella viscosa]CED61671.1 putative acetyltransferase [Moritella viscosa]SGY90283.1 Acetyltransferase, isoleucine patch superfamily protein [Moritella viscosa]SGY98769.1 Acetyltransferase, isoleucine patch superfamily protein [Moritella viscosa]SGY99301.1 Acetyltransferase, isoleucine patch superfamily protein [Moritella viscosa]SHO05479.1 Acetyltransferase, isoleucine patch superfamily protein [Moritella viscosa]